MTPKASGDYSSAQLEAAIRRCGVQEGDTVFTHVGMGMLGFPDTGKTQDAMFDAVLGAYRRVLGDRGTLLVPTYSYSFCRSEPYDPAATPSTVGAFTEAFRLVPGVKRSREPIFSVAGFGPAVDALFRDLPRECFGPDCVYDRLVRAGAKLCNIGVGFRYATFIHYVEQSCAVPYRFLKLFVGEMRDGGVRERQNWLYNVAVLQPACYPDLTRLERVAFERGAASKAPVGRGQVTCIGFRELDALCREGIGKDPWYLAKGPPRDVEPAEALRVGEAAPRLTVAATAGLKERLADLWAVDAYPVTAACDAVLAKLGEGLELETAAVASGTRLGDRIVPERWTCRSATLTDDDGVVAASRTRSRLLVPYFSHPVDAVVERAELERRVDSRAGAAPSASNLHQQRWGLAMSRERLDALTAPRYSVSIDAAFSWGRMRIGHGALRPRDARPAVVLLAHHDHGGLANEGLSGAVAAAETFRRLRAAGSDAAVRLVLAPRDLGFTALLQAMPSLREGIACVLRLEALGLDGPLVLQGLVPPAGAAGRLRDALSSGGASWVQGAGPWVRDGEADALGLPGPLLALSRAPRPCTEEPFDGFRTERDGPSGVDDAKLERAVTVLFEALRSLSAA